MGKEPHDGGAGTSQTPGQPQAIPNVRPARPAESAGPRHGPDTSSECGIRLYGQATRFTAIEEGNYEAEAENVLMVC